MRILKALAVLIATVAVAIAALRIAFPIPERPETGASAWIPASEDTSFGRQVLSMAREHPGLSGVAPLFDGRDALSSRVLMARRAQQTLDAQYYIWQADTTGWILLDEFRAAADRGVRVRLLLDDNGIPELDNVLAALDAHENVEVRIFNPFTLRRPKLLSFVFDFPRLNRRMHNKAMIADGAITIVGGRNIGDIYFAYGEGTAYFDLDVLAVGPIVDEVSENFDDYWNSGSAYPAHLLLPPSRNGLETLSEAAADAAESTRGSDYMQAVTKAPFVSRVLAGEPLFEWTKVTFVSDDPSKGLGNTERDALMLERLADILELPETRVDLVSAYLIPGRAGTDLIRGWEEAGIETRLMTNSLEATDVPPVHSAWMGYRKELVKAGSEILELRARPDLDQSTSLAQLLTGSASSLHAKTFAIDDARIFIGSFNFDPRSASLNTEMGMMIESPAMARALSGALDQPNTVYRVTEARDGSLQWIETHQDGETVIWDVEPNTSVFQRGLVRLISWLPVEWLL